MKVAKFGGSSLADARQIEKVCSIVLADPQRRIVVVSAPGKRHASDTKVTDLLITLARTHLETCRSEAELQAVLRRYGSIQQDLGLEASVMEEIERDLRARVASDRSVPERYLDRMKAAGEDNAARLFAAALRKLGAEAHYVDPGEAGMLLTSDFGNAQVLPESYARLESLREMPGIKIFPGFFGRTREGEIVTFPRGGSDITGAILAAAVKADAYENFTDVDSVYSADPRIVEGARPIGELTYAEMRELAYAGFGVFHDEAIVPAVRAGIPIWILNTNRPEAAGTRIVPHRKHEVGSAVGIASDAGFCTLYVSKYLMNREVGFTRRALQLVEDEKLSYEHIPSGIDNLSIVLRERGLDAVTENRLLERFRGELGVDDVSLERGLALVMIVGEGMRYAVGLAARATRALADSGTNIEMMSQGASEISMMFGVKAVERERAVRALYGALFAAEGVAS